MTPRVRNLTPQHPHFVRGPALATALFAIACSSTNAPRDAGTGAGAGNAGIAGAGMGGRLDGVSGAGRGSLGGGGASAQGGAFAGGAAGASGASVGGSGARGTTAVEDAYSDLLKANSFRIPINEPTVNDAAYWASYRAIIDAGIAKKMKVLLGFWAKDTNIGKPADIGVWYTMWGHVIDAYGSNPYVFFDIHNEPHGYSNAEWIQQVKDWLAKFPNVPKNRVVVAGTGWDDNVANVATAFPDMPLLEVHDYVFNGNYPGSQKWGQQLLGRLGSGVSRTLVGEFGTGVANVDFSTGVESDPGKSFVVGFTNAIHDNNMGSCWWPGLWAVPGNSSSWGLLKMVGTQDKLSYAINSQSALDRIWHGWGLK